MTPTEVGALAPNTAFVLHGNEYRVVRAPRTETRPVVHARCQRGYFYVFAACTSVVPVPATADAKKK